MLPVATRCGSSASYRSCIWARGAFDSSRPQPAQVLPWMPALHVLAAGLRESASLSLSFPITDPSSEGHGKTQMNRRDGPEQGRQIGSPTRDSATLGH